MTVNNQEMIADILMAHLPSGSYDNALDTLLYHDIMAHSKAFSDILTADEQILSNIERIPLALLADYEREYGLPLGCGVDNTQANEQTRLAELERVMREGHVKLNRQGLQSLFDRYNQQIVAVKTYVPMQCTGKCTDPVNSERLRFKATVTVKAPLTVSMPCLERHFLPAALRIDLIVQN
ncbi:MULTISPECIES: hypothetical protein [unclassified Moraxella]|uniref:hypothetical protein n=1 Tax=unclassified Moraxella TaxID=2685852 RepID=UPI003AF95516